MQDFVFSAKLVQFNVREMPASYVPKLEDRIRKSRKLTAPLRSRSLISGTSSSVRPNSADSTRKSANSTAPFPVKSPRRRFSNCPQNIAKKVDAPDRATSIVGKHEVVAPIVIKVDKASGIRGTPQHWLTIETFAAYVLAEIGRDKVHVTITIDIEGNARYRQNRFNALYNTEVRTPSRSFAPNSQFPSPSMSTTNSGAKGSSCQRTVNRHFHTRHVAQIEQGLGHRRHPDRGTQMVGYFGHRY